MTRLSDAASQNQHFGANSESFEIVELSASSIVRERLLELGLAPGHKLQIFKKLPFGGPIVVRAGSLSLALRQDEAEQIWLADSKKSTRDDQDCSA